MSWIKFSIEKVWLKLFVELNSYLANIITSMQAPNLLTQITANEVRIPLKP